MKEEIWKDIENYEGKYQVNNFGNVKSLNYRKTGKEHLLTPKRVQEVIYKRLYMKMAQGKIILYTDW